jgi:methionyl aminopeptidase
MGERITALSGAGKNQIKIKTTKNNSKKSSSKLKDSKIDKAADGKLKPQETEGVLGDYIKAGEIAKKTREYAASIIKPGMPLLEIAEKIESKIIELGGKVGFPVNLAIDDIAAHYHPTMEDKTLATGLLKVDLGIHVNGFIADSAFSIDLTEDKKYTELIQASVMALNNALEILKKDPTLNDIGEVIQKTIQDKGFSPIVNLSGHGLDKYEIHSGLTIPNYANGSLKKLEKGAYAIEPFATTGEGRIYEGQGSNIYALVNYKNTRGPTARMILEYVAEKYKTLPFSLREMQKKFGPVARIGLKELEQAGIIHHFPQLIEKSHKPVSQAEHTFIKNSKGEIIVTTR